MSERKRSTSCPLWPLLTQGWGLAWGPQAPWGLGQEQTQGLDTQVGKTIAGPWCPGPVSSSGMFSRPGYFPQESRTFRADVVFRNALPKGPGGLSQVSVCLRLGS